MIKAVVDANLLVSAFISPFSYPREIERCWRRGEFNLVTSREIVEEINHVLHLPRARLVIKLCEWMIISQLSRLMFVEVKNLTGCFESRWTIAIS